jgi:osmotically-inducible protein OsmY
MTHKRGLSLSLWLFLALILVALGAPERASGQAKNGGFDDALISERVKAAINDDATLRTMDIAITVLDKVVHLSGFVNSLTDMARAEELARKVRGVSAVRNSIRVENRPSRA